MRGRARGIWLVAAFGVMAAGCSDEPSSDGATTAAPTSSPASPASTVAAPTTAESTVPENPETTTTTVPAETVPLFDQRGPHAVGVLTLDLGDRKTEVYYPADPGAAAGQPTEAFDALTVFPEAFRSLIPEGLGGTFDVGAHRDVPVASGGPFPVVIYSHGFSAYRQVASFSLAHLASWGFVVASTDHLERGSLAVATALATSTFEPGPRDQDLTDVRNTLTALREENDTPDGLLLGQMDLDHVGITGHSAGALTAVRAAVEIDDIDAFISISGAPAVSIGGDEIGVTYASITGLEPGRYEVSVEAVMEDSAIVRFLDEPGQLLPLDALEVSAGPGGTITLSTFGGAGLTKGTIVLTYAVPTRPGLVVIGHDDKVVPKERSLALFDGLEAPRYLVDIAAAGHNSFTDSCPLIRDQGGLGALRELAGVLADLGEDGCTAAAVDPLLVQRVLDHYSTAFFLTYLRAEDQGPSLAVDVVQQFGDISLAAFAAG